MDAEVKSQPDPEEARLTENDQLLKSEGITAVAYFYLLYYVKFTICAFDFVLVYCIVNSYGTIDAPDEDKRYCLKTPTGKYVYAHHASERDSFMA